MSSFVSDALDEIRRKVQATDADLREARDRRDAVLEVANTFEGVLRTFASGSIAHRTALAPANDADCGLVLDRRMHPELGPDGDGVGSADVVESIRSHLRDGLKEAYPSVTYRVTKRAIYVSFGDDGPTVDLVVALNRKDAPGLWIPHTEGDDWDASDPEKHTELCDTASAAVSGSTFRRTIRLAKAWNNQFVMKLCSFNLEALALASIVGKTGVEAALIDLLKYAEVDLKDRLTPDPAGVSDPIKLPMGLTRVQASERLGRARKHLEAARDADDDQTAADEMKKVFDDYATEIDKVRLDRQLCGTAKFKTAPVYAAPILATKQPRSWGDDAGRRYLP